MEEIIKMVEHEIDKYYTIKADVRQYRKKPVIVEAVQLDNINAPCVVRWIGEDKAKINMESDEAWKLGKAPPVFSVTIHTLEGDMKAMSGDYIIKGVHGEYYPCKPDIFEKTYEAVEPPKEETLKSTKLMLMPGKP